MPFISKAQELRKKNAELHAQMTALSIKAHDEDRELTAEEREQWNRMDAEYEARLLTIKDHEKLEERERDMNALDPRRIGREDTPNGDPKPDEAREKQRRALRAFISQAPGEWDGETREIVMASQSAIPPEVRKMGRGFVLAGRRDLVRLRREARFSDDPELQSRALTAAANATVAEDFMSKLDEALLSFAGIAQAAEIVETDTGADMPFPTVDDTANTGALLAEGSAAVDTADPTLAAVTLQAFLYTSKIVRVPNQLIQDSAFPVEGYLAGLLGKRLGRIMNTHGTTGTGTSQPRGIVTGLLADTTAVIPASATALAYADLTEVQHAVDPAYRAMPKVAWMFHDQILMAIKNLVDGQSRPLWMPGLASREPDNILGKPYFINQAMDSTIAEDKETVIFGDFSHYVIRRTLNPILMRLEERYAEFFQTGFVMFERWDSDLINGAATPLAVISHNLV